MKTALTHLWRLLPPDARRTALYRASAALAPKARKPIPTWDGTVTIAGELSRPSGLGAGARLMAHALRQTTLPTHSLDLGTLTAPKSPTPAEKRSIPPHAALILHVNSPQMPIALTRLGRNFTRTHPIIGHWAWELPTLPPIWRTGLACTHTIWVPSRFTADALQTITKTPIAIVPYPIATDPPRPSALTRADFNLPANAVIVMVCFSLASSFTRKNPLAAIRAFREAFGNRPDRHLVLKLSETDHYPDDMTMIRAAIHGATNIQLETRTFPEQDLHALMRHADIVLSLHRSEGFGLIPAQAMLLERTIISTDWSATAEYLDETCALPARYTLIPAHDPRGVFHAPNAVWAEADIAHAAQQLRLAADNAPLRAQLGKAARKRAEERFSAAPLMQALETLRPRP